MIRTVLATAVAFVMASAAAGQHVLLEAEQFADLGGWQVDQQSMDVMGSPYVLAHGLGIPVKDAVTRLRFPVKGTYRLWVRTRDWVAAWKAPGAPGKFQLLVNGRPVRETFGTKGAEWHWQDGGNVEVDLDATIALHDLTGFEGRCDAILFTRDQKFNPPNANPEMTTFRRALLNLDGPPDDGGSFDLVVVGGGVAGTCAALSAARNGLAVAFIQDRPVLGGNSSSEVRVWPEGHTRQKPFRRIGDVVEEICPPKRAGDGNAKGPKIYADDQKMRAVGAEPRITLMLEQRVNAVDTKDKSIVSVTAQHIRTARRTQVRGKLFADCTGDAAVGFLAGADYQISTDGVMGASNLWNLLDQSSRKQVLECECKDKDALVVQLEKGETAAPFPKLTWALDLANKPFPGRSDLKGQGGAAPLTNLGGWFWESGFDKDMIRDVELIRDQNLRAMYGAWDALRNTDGLYPNHRIAWAAFIAGKRESRRLLGDVVLKADDFRNGKAWPDPAFPNTWHIDIHVPHPAFSKEMKGEEFISQCTSGKEYSYKGPYWAPYRCLYSRNIRNLFMAGRDVSVEHEALGPVRVMRTCGMMGEIVGKAAWICVRHDVLPRGVYERHLATLRELMSEPGVKRRESLTGELQVPPGAVVSNYTSVGLDPAQLEGVVVDDESADLKGNWAATTNLAGFVADGYRYSSDPKATARFPFSVTCAGVYEVRVSWAAHPNRAKSANILVHSLDGEKQVTLDQTKAPTGQNEFQSIGAFRFDDSKNFDVVFRVAGSKGVVHIDAVQVAPAKSGGGKK